MYDAISQAVVLVLKLSRKYNDVIISITTYGKTAAYVDIKDICGGNIWSSVDITYCLL